MECANCHDEVQEVHAYDYDKDVPFCSEGCRENFYAVLADQ